jgi:hypothetical protein
VWLYSGNITGKLNGILERRTAGTGAWFLNEFHAWLEGASKVLLCPGLRILLCERADF